jgi:hypothetical protein
MRRSPGVPVPKAAGETRFTMKKPSHGWYGSCKTQALPGMAPELWIHYPPNDARRIRE